MGQTPQMRESDATAEVWEAWRRFSAKNPDAAKKVPSIRSNPNLQKFGLVAQVAPDGAIEVNPFIKSVDEIESTFSHELVHVGGGSEENAQSAERQYKAGTMPQSPPNGGESEKVIEIPGVGNIAFPSHMTPDQINTAAAKLYAEANPNQPSPPKQRSWIDTATDWLPTAGGAVGGVVGGIGGTVGGVGVGGVPGAIGGATLGGGAGEAAKQLINRWRGNDAPTSATEAATGIATQGALQGGAEAVGGMAVKSMTRMAPALMQSALKPGIKNMSRVIRGKEQVPRVVQTLLNEGVNVTPGGVRKITSLLDSTNDEIANLIKNSTGVVYPEKVAGAADEVAARFSQQVNPLKDTSAVRAAQDEFLTVKGGAPNYPLKPIPVQEAQALKQGTYKSIGSRAYEGQKGAAVEAEKALARGLKEGIEDATKGQGNIKALNQRDSALIEAQEAVGRRVAQAMNRDPVGLGWLTNNPAAFIGFLMTRSPAVKSMLARGLYQSAERVTHVPQNLIRLGMQSLAVSHEQEPQ